MLRARNKRKDEQSILAKLAQNPNADAQLTRSGILSQN